MKLYELTEMYQNVWNLIEDEDVDIESLEMALNQIEENIELKAEGMAKLIKSIDGDVAALKEEENRLANKRKTLENKQKNIKTYLEYQLIGMGIDKVKTPLFTVALQNNPPSVRFIDEALIPEQYKVRTELVSIPKKLILDDIKEGKEVAGCELVQGKSLRIR